MFHCPYQVGEYDPSLGVLICRPVGELTADVAHDIAICRECIINAGLEQVDRFHDLTGITSVNLRFEDVFRLTSVEAKFRQPEQPVKACYLVPNKCVYGTIRMYQAMAESQGVTVHVSYDLQELAEVLGVDAARLMAGATPADQPG